MKTAKEMTSYIKENKFYRQFTFNQCKNHFILIEELLHIDEEVILCCSAINDRVKVTRNTSNFLAFAMTNKRIIIAQKRFIKDSITTISYDFLNDIKYKAKLMKSDLIIDTMKETIHLKLDSLYAENIFKLIDKIVNDLKIKDPKDDPTASKNTSPESTVSVNKLREFKQLLDEEVITQEEFELKKKELLKL